MQQFPWFPALNVVERDVNSPQGTLFQCRGGRNEQPTVIGCRSTWVYQSILDNDNEILLHLLTLTVWQHQLNGVSTVRGSDVAAKGGRGQMMKVQKLHSLLNACSWWAAAVLQRPWASHGPVFPDQLNSFWLFHKEPIRITSGRSSGCLSVYLLCTGFHSLTQFILKVYLFFVEGLSGLLGSCISDLLHVQYFFLCCCTVYSSMLAFTIFFSNCKSRYKPLLPGHQFKLIVL